MGRGISGAIPITFGISHNSWKNKIEKEDFSEGFFDCYDEIETDGEILWEIKRDLLVQNYNVFLDEFNNLIELGERRRNWMNLDSIPPTETFDEFEEAFDYGNRNGRVPFLYDNAFSTIGCECRYIWKFYAGSYKAFLEEYTTLTHFERVIAKSMKNPLAKAVKFGIFG
jgi:hypothetical protein